MVALAELFGAELISRWLWPSKSPN